jgi:hypothetical protein
MVETISHEDRQLLDDLGVETTTVARGDLTAREQRIIAGFEEILKFVEEQGRQPQHGENRDIFERLYAVRLDAIRRSSECREVLKDLDTHGLLSDGTNSEDQMKPELSDEELVALLGIASLEGRDITELRHVRSREEIRAAEEIAQRNRCENFVDYAPIFEKAQHELEFGQRQTVKYKDNAEIQKGDLFILEGQKVLVADWGEEFLSDYGRRDRRLRVIYDNGTESDLLARSLQRALNRDKSSRRIVEPGVVPLFSSNEEEGDLPTGYIYILESKSDNPFVAENRSIIHKIGVTGGDVKTRIANAKKDPTYLLSDVEIVATYKLANVNRIALEALLHKCFAKARLDMELKDRFGALVEPREWFLVPLSAIDEAIQRIKDGSIANFVYDPREARLVQA